MVGGAPSCRRSILELTFWIHLADGSRNSNSAVMEAQPECASACVQSACIFMVLQTLSALFNY